MRSASADILVLVVEDQRLMRELLVELLTRAGIHVVDAVGSVAEGLEIARQRRPDVVLMDFHLPDGDGAEAAAKVLEEVPGTAVLFLSGDFADDAMLAAVEAGACGYVGKEARPEELVALIKRAADGEFLIPPGTISRLLQHQRARRRESAEMRRVGAEITPRELQVLGLLGEGYENQRVADELGISYETARTHVRSILGKLLVNSRLEAVAVARRAGLIADV